MNLKSILYIFVLVIFVAHDRADGLLNIPKINLKPILNTTTEIVTDLADFTLNEILNFRTFKTLFKKVYATVELENIALLNFLINLRDVDEHNEKYKKGLATFERGICEYSDLSADDMNMKVNKFRMPEERPKRRMKKIRDARQVGDNENEKLKKKKSEDSDSNDEKIIKKSNEDENTENEPIIDTADVDDLDIKSNNNDLKLEAKNDAETENYEEIEQELDENNETVLNKSEQETDEILSENDIDTTNTELESKRTVKSTITYQDDEDSIYKDNNVDSEETNENNNLDIESEDLVQDVEENQELKSDEEEKNETETENNEYTENPNHSEEEIVSEYQLDEANDIKSTQGELDQDKSNYEDDSELKSTDAYVDDPITQSDTKETYTDDEENTNIQETDEPIPEYQEDSFEEAYENPPKIRSIISKNDILNYVTKGFINPIQHQGVCGSCWSFSATAAIEGAWFLKTGKLIKLSEQQLIDCNRNQHNNGCDGGDMSTAFTFVEENGGLTVESKYPYRENDTFECKSVHSAAQILSHEIIEAGDEDWLKEMLIQHGPISVAIDASLKSFQTYKNGIYYDSDCTSKVNHAMLLVGYGTVKETNEDYWILKNTYGQTWGIEGYMRLARNRDNHCGITEFATYPIC